MKKLIWLGILSVGSTLLTGCGDSQEPAAVEDAGQAIAEKVVKELGIKPADGAAPCEILSDELIHAHFSLDPEVEISRSPSKYSPHPLCTVSWEKPNAAEIQQESAAAMSDYMARKMKGEDVKMPSFQTTNSVSLTLLTPLADDPQQAVANFDAAMKTLSDGITRTHNGVTVTFQADLVAVDGVGDKAMWAAKMHQLSVVSGRQIFHLTVKTDEDRNLELQQARAIATKLSSDS